MSWNGKDMLSSKDVKKRKGDIKRLVKKTGVDILLLQEIGNLTAARAVRDAMNEALAANQKRFKYVACSDFSQPKEPGDRVLEVAIISKYEMDEIIEYDPDPDDKSGKNVFEFPLAPATKLGITKQNTARGYLWAKFAGLRLTVANLHLKSSGGRPSKQEELKNARKREFVAAAVAMGVNEDRQLYPGHSILVAGDMNVGHSDKNKNGKDLSKDCHGKNCGSKDRYDETHALLRGGLVDGLKMFNLCFHIKKGTYWGLEKKSPIDNMYVVSPGKRFAKATRVTEGNKRPFGSDHYPVSTVYTVPK